MLFAMTLDTLIMLSGVAVALLPFLGFPPSWDKILFLLLGILVLALGIVVRRRAGHVPHVPDEQYNAREPLEGGEVA